MKSLPTDLRFAALRAVPVLQTIRFCVLSAKKDALYPLRHLPGSSLVFGPPRGVVGLDDDLAAHGVEATVHEPALAAPRILPSRCSAAVAAVFERCLDGASPAKISYRIDGGRWYWTGHGGCILSRDDRIVVPAAPMRNEWRSARHPELYRLRVPRPRLRLRRAVVVDTREAHGNYCHFMRDHLPRFHWLRRMGLDLDKYDLVATGGSAPFHAMVQMALMRAGFEFRSFRTCDAAQSIQADELVIPSLVTAALTCAQFAHHASEIEFARELFLDPFRSSPAGPLVYVSRKRSSRRSAAEAALASLLASRGFDEVCLEDWSVREQAALFAQASVVVGTHGAGLANLVFCSPGARVVEVFGPKFIVPDFWALACRMELDYSAFCDGASSRCHHRVGRLAPIELDPAACAEFIEETAIAVGVAAAEC